MPAASVVARRRRRGEGDAEADREEGHHLAGRGGSRVDPGQVAGPVVAGVVVDRQSGHGREQRGVPVADGTGPRQVAAVAEDDEVVVDAGLRVGPDRRCAREKGVEGRDCVAGGDGRPPAPRFDDPGDGEGRPRASASGFSCPIARTARAPAIRSTTTSGTAAPRAPRPPSALTRPSPAIAAGSAATRIRGPARGPASAARRALRGLFPRLLAARLARRRIALARQPGHGRRQRLPAGRVDERLALRVAALLQLLEDAQHAGAARRGVVEGDVEGRDPPQPEPGPQLASNVAHGPLEGGQAAARSASPPMTLTQTRAWLRSGVVSTSVTVANPMRGSWTSLARIRPISCAGARRRDRCAGSSPAVSAARRDSPPAG